MEKRTGQKPREVIGWKRQRQEDNRQREGGEERQERSMFFYFQTSSLTIKQHFHSVFLYFSSEKEEGEEEIQ